MKKLSIFLALLVLMFTELAFGAGGAVATTITGTVQVQTGAAPLRVLRQGDEVAQGDTVMTGAASAAVLKFDDGQVAALTANSRMTITAYQYNPQTGGGNILLSLIGGGMRAITGLIGKRSPSQVAYRAATATIGIRGTDTVLVVTPQGEVYVTVSDGAITFLVPGQAPVTVQKGEAVRMTQQGFVTLGQANAMTQELSKTPAGQAVNAILNSVNLMQEVVNLATFARAFNVQEGQTLLEQGQTTVTTAATPAGSGGGGSSNPPSPQ